MLEVNDLHVSYSKVRAVHGVSLEVEEGEIVALIGANGAGKSSTMHAVCGIERPPPGRFASWDNTSRACRRTGSCGVESCRYRRDG